MKPKTLRKSKQNGSIILLFVIFGLLIFLVFFDPHETLDPIRYDETLFITKGESTNTINFLSEVGVGALAGVLAIVISVTLMAVQFSSQEYSPMIMENYVKSSLFWALIIVYISTILLNVFLLNWINDPTHPGNLKLVDTSILLTMLCFLLLIPYFYFCVGQLKPAFIFESMLRRVNTKFIKRNKDKKLPLSTHSDPVSPIIEIIEESMKSNDRSIINIGIREMYNHWIAIKNDKFISEYFKIHFFNIADRAIQNSDADTTKQVVDIFKTMAEPHNLIRMPSATDHAIHALFEIAEKAIEKKLVDITIYILEKLVGIIEESRCLFSWDNVPGSDSGRLLRFLRDDLDIALSKKESEENFEKTLKIYKEGVGMVSKLKLLFINGADDSTIIIKQVNENLAKIRLDEKNKKATLEIRGKIHDLKVKKKNNKLYIFDSEKFYRDYRDSFLLLAQAISIQSDFEQAAIIMLEKLFDFEEIAAIYLVGLNATKEKQREVALVAIEKLVDLGKKSENNLKKANCACSRAFDILVEATSYGLDVQYEGEMLGAFLGDRVSKNLNDLSALGNGYLFSIGAAFENDLEDEKYLFNWDNDPGDDNGKLRRYLRDDFDIDWAENAKINKSPDGMTINISKDNENSAKIIIDEKKEKAILKISDGRTDDLKVKKEGGKLNIYDGKVISDNLKEEFVRNNFLLSEEAKKIITETGNKWEITDEEIFIIMKEGETLNIYKKVYCTFTVKRYSDSEIVLEINNCCIKTVKNFDDEKIKSYCRETRSNLEQGREAVPICMITFSYLTTGISKIMGREFERKSVKWNEHLEFPELTFRPVE